jgi:hypothetical protein
MSPMRGARQGSSDARRSFTIVSTWNVCGKRSSATIEEMTYPSGEQPFQIAGQRRRIAGDVGDALGHQAREGANERAREPTARRVEDDEVHRPQTPALSHKPRVNTFVHKPTIPHSMGSRIETRKAHGARIALHSDDLGEATRERHREKPDAAEEIERSLPFLSFGDEAEQLRKEESVRLKEGPRIERIRDPPHRPRDRHGFTYRVNNDASILPLSEIERAHIREAFRRFPSQPLQRRVQLRAEERALKNRTHLMRRRPVIADLDTALRDANLHLRAKPIPKFFRRNEGNLSGPREATETHERFPDDIPLDAVLSGVMKVLELTPTTCAIIRTDRISPIGRSVEKPHQTRPREIAPFLGELYKSSISRRRQGDEHNPPSMPRQPLAPINYALDNDFNHTTTPLRQRIHNPPPALTSLRSNAHSADTSALGTSARG